MKKNILILPLLLVGVISVHAQKKEEKKLIVETIEQNDQKLKIFWERSMVDSLVDLYTSNSYYIPEYGEMLDSKENIEKKLKAEFKGGLKVLQYNMVPTDHKVYDDLVIEVGVRTIKYTTGENKVPVTEKYNYQIIWKKTSGGKYKIRSEMWNLTKK